MESLFEYKYSFNADIGGWDVSKVTSMSAMFQYAIVFNQPIGSWDVSSVTSMRRMFFDTPDFSQNLSTWCVVKVSDYTEFDTESGLNTGQLPVWNPVWRVWSCPEPTPCTVGDNAADPSEIKCGNGGAALGTAGDCACDCTGTLYSGPTCTQCTAESPAPCVAFTSTSLKEAVDLYTDEDTKDEAIATYGLIGTW
jgi:surface protein